MGTIGNHVTGKTKVNFGFVKHVHGQCQTPCQGNPLYLVQLQNLGLKLLVRDACYILSLFPYGCESKFKGKLTY